MSNRYPTAYTQSTIWILIAAVFSFLALSFLVATWLVNHGAGARDHDKVPTDAQTSQQQ